LAAEGVVSPETKLVITEGNYLLLDQGGWAEVAPELTESWYVEVADQLRLDRLVKRHHQFGKDMESAYTWANGSDEKNAVLVEGTKSRANVIIHLDSL
jgi:pantothenate kinase